MIQDPQIQSLAGIKTLDDVEMIRVADEDVQNINRLVEALCSPQIGRSYHSEL
jgi:hypothetical protein